MEQINPFLQQLPDMLGIFTLMCVSFLLGYFASYWLQRSKKRKLIERLKKEINAAKQEKVNNIETIFTEIKPKILEVIQEEKKETLSPEAVAERTRNNLVNYTKSKPTIDFDSIGRAEAYEKDDLTRINGIGPYVEEKLNEIGIYTYSQISRLEYSDIRAITESIDFFPGRIERDNWVGQAKHLQYH
ncbi:hypothetical protein [Luteirhabdus pelagi]|uniref:hypothetical protein n=1 Tax=Luteirhabdus pelagi TaxID=2792783 RepID=UPI00193A2664|nr:hypothetical protein [Luteirhabdus pelagi]MCT8340327.1 hypothetical protein [Thermobacterium salinum]